MPIKETNERIMITLDKGVIEILDTSRIQFTKCKMTRSEFIQLSIIAFTQALIDNSLQKSQNDGKESKEWEKVLKSL